MSEEKELLVEKPKLPPKKKVQRHHRSGKLFMSEQDVVSMKKYAGKLLKQLGLKVGTRSWKV